MKNKEFWSETKFVKTKKGYMPSKDEKHLGIGSRFVATIQIKIYEKIIQQYANGYLLDLGCGNVPFYGLYKDKIFENVCVDWSNSFHKNPYLDFEVNLNEEIPLSSEQFDTILATDVLEHITKPDILMSEIARLLKPQGKVIITVPFFYWLHEKPHDYFRYTEFALKMFCEQNNLKILLLQAYGGVPEIILDIVAKKIERSRLVSKLHLISSNFFINSNLGKKVSFRTSNDFPLGYCLVAQK